MCDGTCRCGGKPELKTLMLPESFIPYGYTYVANSTEGWWETPHGHRAQQFTETWNKLSEGYDAIEFRAGT